MMLRRNRCTALRMIPVPGKIRGFGIEAVVVIRPGEEIIAAFSRPLEILRLARQIVKVERRHHKGIDRLLVHAGAVDRARGAGKRVHVPPDVKRKAPLGHIEIAFVPGALVHLEQCRNHKAAD